MPFLLLLTGGAISVYCLRQFKRWLGEPQESAAAGSQRLEALVDELVATAEATALVVQEKADRLAGLIAEADKRLGVATAVVQPVAVAAPEPAVEPPAEPVAVAVAGPVAVPVAPVAATGVPEAHRRVYALADEGQNVTVIARQLGLTKGEVLLILGLRK